MKGGGEGEKIEGWELKISRRKREGRRISVELEEGIDNDIRMYGPGSTTVKGAPFEGVSRRLQRSYLRFTCTNGLFQPRKAD